MRSCWDYTWRLQEFLAWAAGVPRRAQPGRGAALERRQDLPARRRRRRLPGRADRLGPGRGRRAAGRRRSGSSKPSVSAGSRDTARWTTRAQALEHAAALRAAGRTAMVQPYLPAVDVAGETALLHFGGAFSHAVQQGTAAAARRGRAPGPDGPRGPAPGRPPDPTSWSSPRRRCHGRVGARRRVRCSTPGSTSSTVRTARRCCSSSSWSSRACSCRTRTGARRASSRRLGRPPAADRRHRLRGGDRSASPTTLARGCPRRHTAAACTGGAQGRGGPHGPVDIATARDGGGRDRAGGGSAARTRRRTVAHAAPTPALALEAAQRTVTLTRRTVDDGDGGTFTYVEGSLGVHVVAPSRRLRGPCSAHQLQRARGADADGAGPGPGADHRPQHDGPAGLLDHHDHRRRRQGRRAEHRRASAPTATGRCGGVRRPPPPRPIRRAARPTPTRSATSSASRPATRCRPGRRLRRSTSCRWAPTPSRLADRRPLPPSARHDAGAGTDHGGGAPGARDARDGARRDGRRRGPRRAAVAARRAARPADAAERTAAGPALPARLGHRRRGRPLPRLRGHRVERRTRPARRRRLPGDGRSRT